MIVPSVSSNPSPATVPEPESYCPCSILEKIAGLISCIWNSIVALFCCQSETPEPPSPPPVLPAPTTLAEPPPTVAVTTPSPPVAVTTAVAPAEPAPPPPVVDEATRRKQEIATRLQGILASDLRNRERWLQSLTIDLYTLETRLGIQTHFEIIYPRRKILLQITATGKTADDLRAAARHVDGFRSADTQNDTLVLTLTNRRPPEILTQVPISTPATTVGNTQQERLAQRKREIANHLRGILPDEVKNKIESLTNGIVALENNLRQMTTIALFTHTTLATTLHYLQITAQGKTPQELWYDGAEHIDELSRLATTPERELRLPQVYPKPTFPEALLIKLN